MKRISLRLDLRRRIRSGLCYVQHAWRQRSGRAVLAIALSLPLVLYGLPSLQAQLEALRFEVLNRQPTGKILLVNIDGPSLRAVGQWPWPRSVYARIIDRLLELGAEEIAFDIDLSSPSSPEQDASLEAALKRANGTVVLAAHKQVLGQDAENRDVVLETRPLDRFAATAWEGSVSVIPEASGHVRWFPEASYYTQPSSAAIGAGLGLPRFGGHRRP